MTKLVELGNTTKFEPSGDQPQGERTPASYQSRRRQLLRVPGIGPKGAGAIIRARRIGNLTDLTHLRKLNIRAAEQAAPYILLTRILMNIHFL